MDAHDFRDLHWLLDIIQSSNIGIVVLDRNLHVEVFNRFMQAHSGIAPERAIGQPLTGLFKEIPEQWLQRRVRSVFDLGIPVYTTWEERPYLFRFPLRLPIHHEIDLMYQNIMFVPLRAVSDHVERVGIVVYDVTDSATVRQALEAAQSELLLLSRTDGLTGLFSRSYWQQRLLEEWQRVQRTRGDATLVMFDIDHFKRINDTYGHPVGDEAIRLTACALRDTAREIDICGRYGGEEFAAILPDTAAAGGLAFCERLRERVAGLKLAVRGETVQFTVSLGVAGLDEGASSSDWLEYADRALYRAKSAGRNQTQVYA